MTNYSKISWEDAFDKFGYDDGDGVIGTYEVERVLIEAGYTVECAQWTLHNVVIESIRKDGVELIPLDNLDIAFGYDDPRTYLPADLIELLDRRLTKFARPSLNRYTVTLTKIVNYEVTLEATSHADAMERALDLEEDAYSVCGGELTADYADLET
jgi:hypothetical protein